jgi:hypothetical protein
MTKKFDINVDPERDEYVVTLRFDCNKNRYDWEGEPTGETHSEIIGIINQETDEFGFAYLIDMSYKDKPDQWTKQFLDVGMVDMAKEATDFIRLCEEWSIPYVLE